MKTENILYLEKRGCDFWPQTPEAAASDVGNYRVCTGEYSVPGKDGRLYFLEFTLWRNRDHWRTTSKRTGAPLKRKIFETDQPFALGFDAEYISEDGSAWGNCPLESAVKDLRLDYTCSDILKAVNSFSAEPYDRIVFAPAEALRAVPYIRTLAGWRENHVLDQLAEVTLKQADHLYTVYTFHGENGDSFDYEANSRRITG